MGFTYSTLTPTGLYQEHQQQEAIKSENNNNVTKEIPSNSRASILEFDGVRILADPGLSPLSTSKEDVSYLLDILPTIDIILLSHPLTSLMGNYAALAIQAAMKSTTGKLNIPVYATQPIALLGKVATIDLYRTLGLLGAVDSCEFELSQVDEAFEHITTVRYSQTLDLRGKFDGLTITALQSGHTLGGTIWVLTKNEEKVTYVAEFNQARDSFLNGADLTNSLLLRSDVVVMGSKFGSVKAYKKRVEAFLDLVSATLGNGGTVFLPTSIGGRLLELIHLVDEHLQSAPIPVLLLAHSKARSLTVAGSLQEWMSPQVIKQWETKLKIPFDASKVDVIEPMDLMNRQGAKVVFAAGAAFETGSLAEEALRLLCADPNTSVVLTERPSIGTVGHQLYEAWRQQCTLPNGLVEDGKVIGFEGKLHLSITREDPLRDEELVQFQEKIKTHREEIERVKKEAKEAAERANSTANANGAGSKVEDESESESEDEDILAKSTTANMNNPSSSTATDGSLHNTGKSTDPSHLIDIDLRSVKQRSKKMFPFIIKKKAKIDDYGIQILPQQFVRIEEKPNFLKHKQTAFQQQQQQQQKKKAVQLSNREKRKVTKDQNKNPWNEAKKQDDTAHLDPLTGSTPIKITVLETEINAKCVLTYLDLEGLADLRTYLGLMTSIKPRNVILIPDQSSSENIERLTNALMKIGKFEVICAVETNTPIVPTNTVQTLDLLMDEELAKSLKWQRISDGYQVAHVMGAVMKDSQYRELLKQRQLLQDQANGIKQKKDEKEEAKDEKKEFSSSRKTQLHLAPLPATSLTTASTMPLAIGDIRLPTLRRTLLQMDYKVEFKGEGTLVVDDCCIVRKLSDGEVVVDGVPGIVVKEVRSVVRGLLAYV